MLLYKWDYFCQYFLNGIANSIIHMFIKCSNKQTLFEQVWAADDFEIFKRMMIQKNIELQLQALEILQHRYGLVPQSFVADGTLPPDENAVMEQVLK